MVNENSAYIGQSQNILERWRQHTASDKKDWFNCAYAITDLRGFSATDLNALEYLFLTQATDAKRFEIMNSDKTDNQKRDYLKDSDFYNSVFSNVNLLLNSIYRGHRIFDKIDTMTVSITNEKIEETSLNEELQNKVFSMNQANCSGKLKKVNEGWLLLKGAQARERDFSSTIKHEGTKKYIQYAIAYVEGKLNENLQTTEDVLFSSPSTPVTALTQQTGGKFGKMKMVTYWKSIELFLITNFPRNAVGISNPCGNLSGRCWVSPLEGVASNEVRARGRLSP